MDCCFIVAYRLLLVSTSFWLILLLCYIYIYNRINLRFLCWCCRSISGIWFYIAECHQHILVCTLSEDRRWPERITEELASSICSKRSDIELAAAVPADVIKASLGWRLVIDRRKVHDFLRSSTIRSFTYKENNTATMGSTPANFVDY